MSTRVLVVTWISANTEASAVEVLRNLGEMFPQYLYYLVVK